MSLVKFYQVVENIKTRISEAETLGVAYQGFMELARMSDAIGFISSGTSESFTSAANAAVSRTYTAVANRRNFIGSIRVGYSGTGVGTLTITDGGTTVFSESVNNVARTITFNRPFNVNSAVVVTLSAGGAGFTGSLNIFDAGVI